MDPTDVIAVFEGLSASRPVFHSEADLQHSFAWAVQQRWPDLRVRLETRPRPGIHLDMLVADSTGTSSIAIELKYLTDGWEGSVHGESFRLLRQSAQDIRGYDCIKDVRRVEVLVRSGYASTGLVLILSNDPSYWRAPTHGRLTNADAFRLHDGLLLAGPRAWGPLTGAGTSRGREQAIELDGQYDLRWRDYSNIGGTRGQFRFLPVLVALEPAGPTTLGLPHSEL